MGLRPYYKVLYFFSLWLDTALRAMGPSKKLGTFCLITLIEHHHLFSSREKWKEIPDTQPTLNSRLIETSHFNSSTCRLVFFEDIPEILDLKRNRNRSSWDIFVLLGYPILALLENYCNFGYLRYEVPLTLWFRWTQSSLRAPFVSGWTQIRLKKYYGF